MWHPIPSQGDAEFRFPSMSYLLRSGRQMVFKVAENICIHILRSSLAFRDGMRAAGIGAHVKLLAEGNQFVDEQFESLKMHVVVARAVHYQQIAAEAGREIDCRALFVSLGTVLRQT